jgi:hypothetical protein
VKQQQALLPVLLHHWADHLKVCPGVHPLPPPLPQSWFILISSPSRIDPLI